MNEIKILTKAEVLSKEFIVYGTIEEPLFLAKDVAIWIEYDLSSINKMIQSVDEDEKVRKIVPTLGGEQEMWLLTESGLYEVLMQSRKPIAKSFKKEVKNILKNIRVNGGYIANQEKLTPEQIVANALIVAQNIINNQNKQIEEMSVKMSELEKKSDYLDLILESKETVTVTQIAQDYGMSAKTFNKLLASLGIQHKVNGQWILYAKYLGEGYVHSRTVTITRSNGMKDTVMNTEWKQKGRIFLYNILKENGYLPLIEQ